MNPTVAKIVSTRPATWFLLKIVPPFDRFILRLSKGRFSSGIREPILLLTTTGAKSHQPRYSPLLYFDDQDRFIVVASNGGRSTHPAWYYNLCAKPEATVLLGGRHYFCSSHEAEGEERARLWELALELNAGYAIYQKRNPHRRIPVIVLTPSSGKQIQPSTP